MVLLLTRGKYVICKIRSRTAADVIEDGAVVQNVNSNLRLRSGVAPLNPLLACWGTGGTRIR
jgi:hypothetical protein